MRKNAMIALLLVLLLFASCGSAVWASEAAEYTIRAVSTDLSEPKLLGSYASFAEAKAAFDQSSERDIVVMDSTGKIAAIKDGMVVTNLKSNDTLDFSTRYDNGRTAYVAYNSVMYYVDTVSESSVKVMIAGLSGNVKLSEVLLIPSAYTASRATVASKYYFDYYTKTKDGELAHYISTYSGGATSFASITIDYAPSFMEDYAHYYSANGYDFYTDPADVVSGKNKAGSFFPYFKYLSLRSKTAYTAEELDRYIEYQDEKRSGSCAYCGSGASFIEAQERYGVNAALELSFANHESAFGTSSFAQKRNNLFGINAKDADPDQATYFASVEQCVLEHAKYLMSRGYLDAFSYIDWSKPTSYYDVPDKAEGFVNSYGGDGRYFGSNLGDKYTGVNVAYASDPFHGEKIAGLMFRLDQYLGGKDYQAYSVGRTNQLTYAYAEPNTSSFKLYKYTGKDADRSRTSVCSGPIGMSMNILGEVGDFYAVCSEQPMNIDKLSYYAWDYDADISVAYVKKSCVDVIVDAGISAYVPPKLSSDNSLSALRVEGAVLSEAFASDRLEYSAEVPYATEKITIIAMASNAKAHVNIGNTNLAVGKNEIAITVSAQNGEVRKYVLTVQRAAETSLPSANAKLSALSVAGYTLNEAFSPERTDYSLSVPYGVDSVNITAAAQDEKAVVSVRAPLLTAGRATKQSVTVTAEDGTSMVYTISVTRAGAASKFGIPTLNYLYVNEVQIPLIDGVYFYSVELPSDTSALEFDCAAADSDAIVYVAGTTAAIKTRNYRAVKVTASNGKSALYRIEVVIK